MTRPQNRALEASEGRCINILPGPPLPLAVLLHQRPLLGPWLRRCQALVGTS